MSPLSPSFPPVQSRLAPNSLEFETQPLIAPQGFREYDARWLYPQELNLLGAQKLGAALAQLLREKTGRASIIVGHDYRSYSQTIKLALVSGLLANGADVHDIGLALSPTAYFAQSALSVRGVAMVTASHNENGWTGIKMGHTPPLTFTPQDMRALKRKALARTLKFSARSGRYRIVPDMRARYLRDLKGKRLRRALKVVLACGNGTAGAFAPDALRALGCKVVPLHCELDYEFPHHNPNPEDMAMLGALGKEVRRTRADIGFAFDGDGDRCGVVDHTGHEIFADKMGVLLARWLAPKHKRARFVVDVKSTSLFLSDPVLQAHGIVTHYEKTGHSYIKQALVKRRALAGFERSGHVFLGKPLGRGYDDGILTAQLICRMLDDTRESLRALSGALQPTWNSPTCSPVCADDKKYGVIEKLTKHLHRQTHFAKQPIDKLITVNGVRIVLEDGSWLLIRASSNKPCLVVVCESPTSRAKMLTLFRAAETLLKTTPQVGKFDQRPKGA